MRRASLVVLLLLGVLAVAAVAMPAGAYEDDRVASNATLTSGETYCEGQRAFFGAPNRSANATYQVVKEANIGNLAGGGNASREIQLDANATAVVPTRNLEGSYVLRNESQEAVIVNESGYERRRTTNASVAAWEVLDCDFSARFRESEVTVRPGETSTATLALTATADDDVFLRTDDLDPETLADLTGGTATGEGVKLPADGDPTLTYPETWACRPGAYEFTVVGNTTGAETTADTETEAAGDTVNRISDDPIKVDEGGTARVPVDTSCNDEATVEFGPANAGFAATATLRTDRAEDNIVLTFDTSRAGSAPATSLFGGAGGGTLSGAEVTTRPSNESLPPGKYEVRALTDGGVTSEATFRVRAPSTPTPSPTPTATPTPTPPATPTPSPTPTASPTPDGGQSAPTPTPSPTRSPTATLTPLSTASSTPTPTTGGTATRSPTASPTPGTTDTTTSGGPVTATGGQPGFGVVVVVAVLVIVAIRSEHCG